MNAELQAKWVEIVRINHDVPAIQAVGAELSSLRQAVNWAITNRDRWGGRWIGEELLRRIGCPGIDLGDGNFSGCDQSVGDCPTCGK